MTDTVIESNTVLIGKLRSMIEAQKALAESNQAEKFNELDDIFHRSLAEFAGKNTAWEVIASMKAHFDRVRYLSSSKKPLQTLVNQHEAVVDAIEQKDAVKADEAIRYHLQEVLRDLPGVVARLPEYFTGH